MQTNLLAVLMKQASNRAWNVSTRTFKEFVLRSSVALHGIAARLKL